MNMVKFIKSVAMAAVISTGVAPVANAGVSIEKKVAHFADPTAGTRTRCAKWAKPWPGSKICVGHAYEVMDRKFYIVVKGPDADRAVMNLLNEALVAAAAAAVGAGVSTSGAAALPAAKTAFVGYLSTRGAQRLISQYSISFDHRTSWPS